MCCFFFLITCYSCCFPGCFLKTPRLVAEALTPTSSPGAAPLWVCCRNCCRNRCHRWPNTGGPGPGGILGTCGMTYQDIWILWWTNNWNFNIFNCVAGSCLWIFPFFWLKDIELMNQSHIVQSKNIQKKHWLPQAQERLWGSAEGVGSSRSSSRTSSNNLQVFVAF